MNSLNHGDIHFIPEEDDEDMDFDPDNDSGR